MVSLRTNLFKVNFIILYLYFTFLIDAMFSLVAILLSDTFCVNTLSKDPLSTSQKTVYRRIIIFREEFIIRDKRVLWNLTTTPPDNIIITVCTIMEKKRKRLHNSSLFDIILDPFTEHLHVSPLAALPSASLLFGAMFTEIERENAPGLTAGSGFEPESI